MRIAKDAAPVQEARSGLLGFGSATQPDRPARVRRSASAKVGFKERPPRMAGELLGFGSVSRPDRPASVRRSVSAKVGNKPPPPPVRAS